MTIQGAGHLLCAEQSMDLTNRRTGTIFIKQDREGNPPNRARACCGDGLTVPLFVVR